MPDLQLPSVGRIVHYVAYGTPGGEFPAGTCRAAIISEVLTDNYCAVVVFNPAGLFFNPRIRFDPEMSPGTWHWPERVPSGS